MTDTATGREGGPLHAWHFGPSTRFVGGMASVIAAIAREQIGADEVTVVETYIPGSHLRSALATGRAIGRMIVADRSVVAHVHMSEGGSFVREGAVVLAAAATARRVVISIHGPGFAEFARRHARLAGLVLRRAQAVTVLSDQDLSVADELAPNSVVRLLPNPTPIDPDSPPADTTPELVLFAGEIGLRKGADVLERAWQRVAATRPDARCLMVGPNVLPRTPQGDRLEVRGPVSGEVVRSLLRQARLVVLPSRGEALPMILTEAMAARRPFVSTPTGGTATLAAGGVLVPVEDAAALADAIIRLLESPTLAAELGRRGQELCQSTRSAAAIDHQLRRLYLG